MPEKDLAFDYPTGGKLHMKDGGGFSVSVQLQKYLSNYLFIKSGFGYIQRRVNPEEETREYVKSFSKSSSKERTLAAKMIFY